MRKYLFEKAKYLNDKGIEITGETSDCILLKVGGHQVAIKYQNRKLIFLCDCMSQSFETFCSHKLAALTYLTNLNQGGKKYGN